jgi:hypothetical protein
VEYGYEIPVVIKYLACHHAKFKGKMDIDT